MYSICVIMFVLFINLFEREVYTMNCKMKLISPYVINVELFNYSVNLIVPRDTNCVTADYSGKVTAWKGEAVFVPDLNSWSGISIEDHGYPAGHTGSVVDNAEYCKIYVGPSRFHNQPIIVSPTDGLNGGAVVKPMPIGEKEVDIIKGAISDLSNWVDCLGDDISNEEVVAIRGMLKAVNIMRPHIKQYTDKTLMIEELRDWLLWVRDGVKVTDVSLGEWEASVLAIKALHYQFWIDVIDENRPEKVMEILAEAAEGASSLGTGDEGFYKRFASFDSVVNACRDEVVHELAAKLRLLMGEYGLGS